MSLIPDSAPRPAGAPAAAAGAQGPAAPVPGGPVPAGPVSAEPAGVDRTFVLLCTAVGLEAAGIGMIYPLLARIQHAHHLHTYALGIISGGAFFAALIGQIGVSHLLDGKRARPVSPAAVTAQINVAAPA